jgi:hypothetical protein
MQAAAFLQHVLPRRAMITKPILEGLADDA